jgi:hypothetical protein
MFQLEEPTKAKLKKAEDKAIKVGQKDLRNATLITLEHVLPNTALEMFDVRLREILYGKGSPGEKPRKQKHFEGMDMVQDLPSLTQTGQSLATLNWVGEQSGCTLTVDHGTGGERSNIILRDGTTKDFKVSLLEGGAIKVRYKFHAPVDHLTHAQLGQLHLMHQRDVKVVLTGPSVGRTAGHRRPGAGERPGGPAGREEGRRAGNALTPIQALKKAEKNAGKADKA